MIQILVATNRKDSRSELLAENVKNKFKKINVEAEVLKISDISWAELDHNLYGADNRPASMSVLVEKINESEGLYVVCPEYNGSFPGAVKTFMDYWDYPKTFEKRPVCFTGLGGIFGGLRPVEHLQQVFGYRNAFIYPERIFLQNVWDVMSPEGNVSDETIDSLMDQQVEGFNRFIKGLKEVKLHCNS